MLRKNKKKDKKKVYGWVYGWSTYTKKQQMYGGFFFLVSKFSSAVKKLLDIFSRQRKNLNHTLHTLYTIHYTLFRAKRYIQ